MTAKRGRRARAAWWTTVVAAMLLGPVAVQVAAHDTEVLDPDVHPTAGDAACPSHLSTNPGEAPPGSDGVVPVPGLPTPPEPAQVLRDVWGGDEAWRSIHAGPARAADRVDDVAVAPDGSAVYAIGYAATNGGDFVVQAVAKDGQGLWTTQLDSGWIDRYPKIDVSADGRTVFALGIQWTGWATLPEWAVWSLDATDGSVRWLGDAGQPRYVLNTATAVTNADGSRVYVAGVVANGGHPPDGTWGDLAVVAYDGATGQRLWTWMRVDYGWDHSVDLELSPDGSALFLTAQAHDHAWPDKHPELAGAGGAGAGSDDPGVHVFHHCEGGWYDMLVERIRTDDGTSEWSTTWDGPERMRDSPREAKLSRDGATLYVVGRTGGDNVFGGLWPERDAAVVAVDTASGDVVWQTVWGEPGRWDYARSLAESPDGKRLYVPVWNAADTGSLVLLTLAPDSGEVLSAVEEVAAGMTVNFPMDVEVSPDGSRAYLHGVARDADLAWHNVVWAFETGLLEPLGLHPYGARAEADATRQAVCDVAPVSLTGGCLLWQAREPISTLVWEADIFAIDPAGDQVYGGGAYAGDQGIVAYDTGVVAGLLADVHEAAQGVGPDAATPSLPGV